MIKDNKQKGDFNCGGWKNRKLFGNETWLKAYVITNFLLYCSYMAKSSFFILIQLDVHTELNEYE